MKQLIIQGGKKLYGSIVISGSKNASLPILAASLLIDEIIILRNIPNVKDISTMKTLLESIGKKIEFNILKNEIKIYPTKIKKLEALYSLVKTMRAGVLVLGPLIAKYNFARVSLPGGCAIGSRPVDLHIEAFKKNGCKNKNRKRIYRCGSFKKIKTCKNKIFIHFSWGNRKSNYGGYAL